ncbi:hypothetical protein BKA64DRAFT_408839 [Cadophora sp. MPI-SDFR-AT-0126]|nr:hypothetical protein BKA64DRAFT_408839 [Leotiomycetes sp. MPI-SDFR-AT-0126]
MDEPRDDKSSTVVNIAVDGDVILVVGPEKAKLRVLSLFLKAASKPFSAMFGPDWREGQNMINHDMPVELLLPEDNVGALKVICAVIHHQNNKVPRILAAGDVLSVAVAADKYGCVDALKFASADWLRPGKTEARDLMLLTAAAYLFQNTQAFKEITRGLILNHDGPYLALSSEEVESAMTWRVFCLLEEQRSFARLKLAEILIAGINDGTGRCIHKCGWTSKYAYAYAYAYLKLLETRGLWPARLFHLSLSKAIDLAEKIPDPIPEESSIACTYEYKHTAPEYRGGRHWSLDIWNNTLGLCLHCVRSGNTNSCCNHGSYST